MDPLFPPIPEDFSEASDDELNEFIAAADEALARVTASPDEHVTDERTWSALLEETESAAEAVDAARAELASRVSDATAQERLAALAASRAAAEAEPEPDPTDPEPEPEPDPEPTASAVEPVVASAVEPEPAPRLPRPALARRPVEAQAPMAALTASINADGHESGDHLETGLDIAKMMEERRRGFGVIAKGTKGEKIPIAKFSWEDMYDDDRVLSSTDIFGNEAKVQSVIDHARIRQEFDRRRVGAPEALVASGGLCAPVTPYYQLMQVSVAARPVRASLPAFSADRGGIKYARPATLASITTGVGARTAAQDAAGGTTAAKTCQTVACPPFQETDVEIIFHCLTFGNLGARTFPERVAQWNNLVLASHARLAESILLDGIDAASTPVNASALGLGASATLPSQILAAAAGQRSRHRMDPETVLRVLLPDWVPELLISDVYRSQFDRFDMNEDSFIALLRDGGVEPTFYLDSATGGGQVFGTQAAGHMLAFPPIVRWYLFAEGSFLYLDGGTLELGLIRDSVLNASNDFQIFGETFENVAFVGVESLAVATTVCDSGTVTLPVAVTCPISY